MGFDRLVMLCLGAGHIHDVQWVPVADPFAEVERLRAELSRRGTAASPEGE